MNTIIQAYVGKDSGRALVIDGCEIEPQSLDFAVNLESGHVQVGVILAVAPNAPPKQIQLRLSRDHVNLVDLVYLEQHRPKQRTLLLTTANKGERMKLIEHMQLLANRLHEKFSGG